MKVLFLDIDGVLNDDETYKTDRTPDGFCGIDSNKVLLLKEIIDSTKAKIVLSSSWKDFWGDETNPDNKYLNDKLAEAGLVIMDKTIDNWANRGEGITNYVKEHDVDNYILLDDEIFDDYEKFNLLDKLILTDEAVGLTKENVKDAIKLLGEEEE